MSTTASSDDVATVPRYQIDLDKPASERWNDVIAIYGGQLRSVEALIDAEIKKEAPTAGPLLSSIVESIMSASAKLKVVYYHEELKAIAKGAEMPLGKLVAMQLIYEACANCTSIVTPTTMAAAGTAAGGAAPEGSGVPSMAHIRTMDWAMDFLRPLTIEVEFLKNGAPLAITTTWVGYVGALTGVALRAHDTTKNFSISVNFRAVGTGTFWTNLKEALSKSWPVGFLVRDSLESATDYNEAVAWLRNSAVIAPTYITVCGVGAGQGCLITREREKELHPWDVSKDGPVIQPNMDHWSNDPNDSIMMSTQRRTLAKKHLTQLLNDTKRSGVPISSDDLWSLMSRSPIFNEITVYGTFMSPQMGILETRLPRPMYGFRPLTKQQAKRVEQCEEGPALKSCSNCRQSFDPALNAPGQCAHAGTWHERFEDCSYLKCGFGLGPSKVGKMHWGCCYATEKDSVCKKSGEHHVA